MLETISFLFFSLSYISFDFLKKSYRIADVVCVCVCVCVLLMVTL